MKRLYKLNDKQIHILKITYKFRFVTSGLLARYKGLSNYSVMNKALAILVERGYLHRKYEDDYRIQGKSASYSLNAKGISYLRDEQAIYEQVLHSYYKNKSVTQTFVDHNLDVFAAYIALRDSYPGTFRIFTKAELAIFDFFPKAKPDIYMNRVKHKDGSQNEFMLDVLSDTQLFVLKKRFTALLEHFESGDWEAESETIYPSILLVCTDAGVERRLQTHIAKVLENAGIDELELKVYTTIIKNLLDSDTIHPAIWSDVLQPGILLAL